MKGGREGGKEKEEKKRRNRDLKTENVTVTRPGDYLGLLSYTQEILY